ncbi:response regulator transcription factor [Cohnella silvisoli]|uniref:Response regulator n=1 Tax=Cohnella silvisoli TaxID=2873699 RepID=A0ABV1L3L5_9BACL|nr:response regulator [Cohnella silvisoli]MCD9025855.1 response regulator [Cohnella silvisoli]
MLFTILLVDDQPIEIETIRLLIERNGLPLRVADAKNGEDALRYLEKNQVDILFTDIRMPFMDGLALSRRALELHEDLKVIIYSAYGEFDYAKQAIQLRVFDYTLKPINVNQFLKLMHKVIAECEQDRLERERQAYWAALEKKTLQPFQLQLQHAHSFATFEEGDETNRKVIDEVVQHVRANYGAELNVEFLAQKVFLSPSYLSALFKKKTGKSLNKFITETRLDIAKSLLLNTNMKIVDISSAVGYANPSYLTLLFKSSSGLTPAQFRERGGAER